MTERPIIFSAPMVRAILAGAKTQTRRVVKPQPPAGHNWAGWCVASTHRPDEGKATWAAGTGPYLRDARRVACPYGQPGNRLWVRETHMAFDVGRVHYRADCAHDPAGDEEHGVRWTPSIHMPRWASRITLEITSVRVERLQAISDHDARAEGIYTRISTEEGMAGLDAVTRLDGSQVLAMPGVARMDYRSLWESLHGHGSWDANPWVWVVEFKRINQTESV